MPHPPSQRGHRLARTYVCLWCRARVFRDDAAAASVDHGSCLIPCSTQARLLMNRYGGRHVMDATSMRRVSQARRHSASRAGHACPSPCHAACRHQTRLLATPSWVAATPAANATRTMRMEVVIMAVEVVTTTVAVGSCQWWYRCQCTISCRLHVNARTCVMAG